MSIGEPKGIAFDNTSILTDKFHKNGDKRLPHAMGVNQYGAARFHLKI